MQIAEVWGPSSVRWPAMGVAVRRWSGVAVIALVALAAPACGAGSEGAGGTTVAASSAADATRAAKSFRVAIEGRTFETDKPSSSIQESHGEGVVDLQSGISRVALTQTHDAGPQLFEQVVIGPDQWVKLPTDVISPPKPWTHVRSRSRIAAGTCGTS